jgi:hypothetical protein
MQSMEAIANSLVPRSTSSLLKAPGAGFRNNGTADRLNRELHPACHGEPASTRAPGLLPQFFSESRCDASAYRRQPDRKEAAKVSCGSAQTRDANLQSFNRPETGGQDVEDIRIKSQRTNKDGDARGGECETPQQTSVRRCVIRAIKSLMRIFGSKEEPRQVRCNRSR